MGYSLGFSRFWDTAIVWVSGHPVFESLEVEGKSHDFVDAPPGLEGGSSLSCDEVTLPRSTPKGGFRVYRVWGLGATWIGKLGPGKEQNDRHQEYVQYAHPSIQALPYSC